MCVCECVCWYYYYYHFLPFTLADHLFFVHYSPLVVRTDIYILRNYNGQHADKMWRGKVLLSRLFAICTIYLISRRQKCRRESLTFLSLFFANLKPEFADILCIIEQFIHSFMYAMAANFHNFLRSIARCILNAMLSSDGGSLIDTYLTQN